MRLEHIDQISVRWRLEFDDPLAVAKSDDPSQAAVMEDCASYVRLRELGYEPRDDQSFSVMQYEAVTCRALELLSQAKPSIDAALTGFLGRADIVGHLPPVLGPQPSPAEVERRTLATTRGLSWAELDRSLVVEEQSATMMKLSSAGQHTTIAVIAIGDFDGDGAQDGLVRTQSYGDEGTWSEFGLWLLGQSQSGPLRVLRRIGL